jgi:hypothetical protein
MDYLLLLYVLSYRYQVVSIPYTVGFRTSVPDDECQENTDDGQTCHVGQEIRSSVQHHSHSTRYRTGMVLSSTPYCEYKGGVFELIGV